MESALSEEEFHRLQLQLIELRTENYQLGDKCKKQDVELKSLNEKLSSVDKEYQRVSKAVSKSKKAKEFDILIQENDSLQRKLHSQEEEFRLQNSTLMLELGELVSKNEDLESRLSASSSEETSSIQQKSVDTNQQQDEIIRLQAANLALQKNIGEMREKFESELQLLRSAVEGVDITESSPSSTDANDASSLNNLIHDSELLSQYNELKLKFDTVGEENRLMKQRIADLEKTSNAEAVEQLREKLKKKQETYVQLQQEKESQYKESSEKISGLESARQRDLSNLHSQINRLKEELSAAKQETVALKEQNDAKTTEYETTITTLKSKVNEASMHNLEQMTKNMEKMEIDAEMSEQRQNELQTSLDERERQLTDTEFSLQALKNEHDEIITKLRQTDAELQEISQVAEKRKKLLDGLAIKSQEDSDSYKLKLSQFESSRKEEIDALTDNHRQEVVELSKLLDEEQAKSSIMDKLKQDLEVLSEQNHSLEETKAWLQRSLQDAEKAAEEDNQRSTQEKEELIQSHDATVLNLKIELETQTKELQERLNDNESKLSESKTTVDSLQLKVKDSVQERKLHEKKGAGLMKDLKRQLAQERKRADKLEQHVQELTTETKIKQPSESFFLPIDRDLDRSGRADDASSISSWSGIHNSGVGTAISGSVREATSSSLRESTPRSSPQTSSTEFDVPGLMVLVDSLQKEKASLSERVSILEQSNAAMADDMIQKQAIIEHYTMEGKEYSNTPKRSEKMTLKRVVDFVKDKGDEGMNEKYRKCQRMLEETLTKNMCLQNDLEILSKELANERKVPS